MGKGISIIDLGKLSEPAKVLVEKVSDAVGGISKPWQIERVAKAEAKADIIKAEARIQITEMEERALVRMVREEGKKQENIENITAGAIPKLDQNAKPENVEEDSVTNFFDRCRLISDREMQSLWSKLLAGEANNPGSYSKRTIELISSLDKKDAQLFTKLCTFNWTIIRPALLIMKSEDEFVNRIGINFSTLNHLDDLGLITFNHVSPFIRKGFGKYATVSYYGQLVTIEFPQDENDIILGVALLTRAGEELFSVCGSEKNDEYFLNVLSDWHSKGYILSTPLGSLYSSSL